MKTSVVVFAREPLPGTVKTRLAATIGAKAACRVYAEMLEWTLRVAASATFEVVLSLAEPPNPSWVVNRGEQTEVQRGTDLGERMKDAFERRFADGFDHVVIVGTDCPGLRRRHLQSASDALGDAAVALGPARDGGYWLVAQRRPGVDLFTRVPWSSEETLAATRRRLSSLGVTWYELEELNDVDTEPDLRAALASQELSPDLRTRLHRALAG